MRKPYCCFDFEITCKYTQEEILENKHICINCLAQQKITLKDKLNIANENIKTLRTWQEEATDKLHILETEKLQALRQRKKKFIS